MRGSVLRRIKAQLTGWLAFRSLLWAVSIPATLALALVLADAAFDLPQGVRVIAPWLLVAGAIAGMLPGLWRWSRIEDRGTALLLERAERSVGNKLINAVELECRQGGSATEEYLRLEAVELGAKAAGQVNVGRMFRGSIRFVAGVVLGAVLAWVILVATGGSMLSVVGPRFTDPLGDHPPYSKLKLTVSPGKAEVLYGGQLEVRVTTGTNGPGVDKLWLVSRSGTNEWRTVMFLAPDKSFFQTLANLREPTEYFVTDGRARSHRYPVGIRYTPEITLVEVSAAFPSYTGRPARTSSLGAEPQSVPEETKVSLRVVSNRPLQSGAVRLTPVLGGQVRSVELKPDAQEKVVTGSFTVTEPVVFSINVKDISGLESAEPRQGRFNITPDERPRVFAMEPGRDAVATPNIRVPIRAGATDDYGITRVAWLRGFNRSIEKPFAMKLELKQGMQSVEAAGALDFSKLGVRPGDVIDYYFEAADNYPKGPNVALSRIYRVEIISEQQYAAVLRQAAARKALFEPYFQLDAWLRRLAERARKLEQQAQNGSAEERQAAAKEAEALSEDLVKYEAELAKLLRQTALFDIEQAFRASMAVQHTRIGGVRSKLEAARGSSGLDQQKLSEAAAELSELASKEQEEVGNPARQVAAVAHLMAKADTFVKLAQQEKALAQMARRFSGRTNDFSRAEQQELQALAERQRQVQQGLSLMLSEMPELLAAIPEDAQFDPLREDVDEFLKAVQEAGIDKDLGDSAEGLSTLQGQKGYFMAQQASDKMQSLISKCQSTGEVAKNCLRFQPSMQQGLGSTLDQLMAAMGAGSGQGDGGKDGYGLFNNDVALYGPGQQTAGNQGAGRGGSREAPVRGAERLAGEGSPAPGKEAATPGRVRLQPDARFPLRYREIVGEYFRVIAEGESGGGETK